MADNDMGTVYEEKVRNPESSKKDDSDGKKGRAGNLEAGNDFGFGKAGVQKGTGPEGVKGIDKPKKGPLTEENEDDMKTKTVRTPVGSSFDRLFERTISEEFDEDGLAAGDEEGGIDIGGDDFGTDDEADFDEGEDDETSLAAELQEIVGRLQEILDNIEGDEGEEDFEGDEFGDEEGMGDEDDIEGLETASVHQRRRPLGEARGLARRGGGQPGGSKRRDGKLNKAPLNIKNLQGKGNKVGGYFGKDTMKGQGHGNPGMSKPRDGVLRPAPDGKGALQGKNNKVSTTSVMGKVGSNLFD